MDPTVTFS